MALALESPLGGQAEMLCAHTEVAGLFGREENCQQGDFRVAWPAVAGQTQCCGFPWDIWVTREPFCTALSSSSRKSSCCLCPHLPDNPEDLRRFLLSPLTPGAVGWHGHGGQHVPQTPFPLGLLGTSVHLCPRGRSKFSPFRTTSGQHLCFSKGKHCWRQLPRGRSL